MISTWLQQNVQLRGYFHDRKNDDLGYFLYLHIFLANLSPHGHYFEESKILTMQGNDQVTRLDDGQTRRSVVAGNGGA